MSARIVMFAILVPLVIAGGAMAGEPASTPATAAAGTPSAAAIQELPEAVYRKEPSFPREALIKRIDGFVVVELDLRPDGTVAKARVLESGPPGLFDKSALDAVKRWRFEPTLVDGVAVPRTITQRLDFRLH